MKKLLFIFLLLSGCGTGLENKPKNFNQCIGSCITVQVVGISHWSNDQYQVTWSDGSFALMEISEVDRTLHIGSFKEFCGGC